MKRLAGIYTLITIVSVFFLPQVSFADDTTLNSQTQGQTTICHNGQCTTAGGGSKTTICHNGQCTTTDDGNVDYESPDGHTQIHVHNNTSDNSTSVSSQPSQASPSDTPEPMTSEEPSLTPDPTIVQMKKDLHEQVKKEMEGFKEHRKAQNAALSDFFKAEVEAFQHLLRGLLP